MSFKADTPFALPFLPPIPTIDHISLVDVLIPARTELAELKGYAHALPNPMLLMSPAILREAVASSNIENINTTVAKALQMQLFPEAERREPDKEVLRYREAMMWGFEKMKELPISTRLIIGIQQQLLPSHSGYRASQNRIINSHTGEVRYTPPTANAIPGLMGNLEQYIHQKKGKIDPLIRCAISHYQFEAIHPFGDGNGRTGRILMVLQLINEGLLDYPILFISGYINRHRREYYQCLLEVSAAGSWIPFIRFMLKGFYEQARLTKEAFYGVMELYQLSKEELRNKLPKVYSADLVDALFSYPVINPSVLSELLNVHRRTASRYLEELTKSGFLEEEWVGKYHLYINMPLISLFNEQ